MEIKEIRENSGLNRSEFSKNYSIPIRTLEDWEAGRRNPPKYVLSLLQKVVEYEKKSGDN